MTTTPADSLENLLSTTDARSRQRCCFLLQVRPERLTEYVEVHQRVWQEMRERCIAPGWRNLPPFSCGPGGRPGGGLLRIRRRRRAMAAMEDEEVNTRWQAEMAQYFVQPSGGSAAVLPQYFRLD